MVDLQGSKDSLRRRIDITEDFQNIRRFGATHNRRYVAGMLTNATALTTGVVAANTLIALPFYVGETTLFDLLGCQVTTAGASSNVRMGIYADDGNVFPSTLINESAAISSATVGMKEHTIPTANQTFSPGLYWLAFECMATAPTIRALSLASIFPILGLNNIMDIAPGVGYTVAHTFGALPNPYTTTATILTAVPIPAISMRAIS